MIRDFIPQDKEELMKMAEDFYNSPAVLYPIPVENFSHCFDEIIKGNPMVRGLTVLHRGEILGYCQLSFTYSSEADGLAGKGVRKQVFDFIEGEYSGKAKRYRLECEHENVNAMKLYTRLGYTELGYVQMIKE